MSYARAFDVTVTVAGATGTGSFVFPKITGVRAKNIIIDAPVGATYDWVLKDDGAYALTGEAGASGDETYYVDLPLGASASIVFVNATNGTYTIRIRAEYN